MHYDHRAAGQALNPRRETSQSVFAASSFPAEFTKWGYRLYEDPHTDRQTILGEHYYGLQTMLRGLGISRRKEDWKWWRISHGDISPGAPNMDLQTYVANGYTYRVRL
jgi:hypothetical protein